MQDVKPRHESHTRAQTDAGTEAFTAGKRAAPARGWTTRRVVGTIAGGVLGLCAVADMTVGGVLAVGGYELDLGAHGHYRSPGYALVTESTNWRTELFGSVDSVRVRAATDGSEPIFVGAGDPAVVHRYLHGVRYTTVHDDGSVTQHRGHAPSTPPQDALDWTALAHGTETQRLDWGRDAGDQVVVAMHPDGSRAVEARIVSSTVTLRSRPAIGGAMLLGGLVLLVGAVILVATPIRRARRSVRS
jgi:hypothetical protein